MEQGSEHIDYIDLITKVLGGEASPEEIQQLDAWKAADPENQSTYDDFASTWDLTEIPSEIASIDVDMEWASFQSSIKDASQEEIKSDPKVIEMPSSPEEEEKGGFSILRIAAAIVLIIGLGAVFMLNTSSSEQIVASNDIVLQQLPDGSSIALNRTSVIEYQDEFNQKERKVTLKGEAHFEVKHNPNKPFIVETEAITVTVLGTDFVVRTFDNDNNVEVIVNTGRVSVKNNVTGEEVILTAGERVDFTKKEASLEKEVNEDENFLSWKTKKFKFRDKSLKRIINKLNRAYGTNIIIQDKQLKKCRMSVQFEDQNIDEILTVIEATLGITVKRTGDQIILTGTAC